VAGSGFEPHISWSESQIPVNTSYVDTSSGEGVSGSNLLMVPLSVSRDVDIRQKFKMAVAKMKCRAYIFYGCIV